MFGRKNTSRIVISHDEVPVDCGKAYPTSSKGHYYFVTNLIDESALLVSGSDGSYLALSPGESFAYHKGHVNAVTGNNLIRRAIEAARYRPEILFRSKNPLRLLGWYQPAIRLEGILTFKSHQLREPDMSPRFLEFGVIGEEDFRIGKYVQREIIHNGIIICVRNDCFYGLNDDITAIIIDQSQDEQETAKTLGKILTQFRKYSILKTNLITTQTPSPQGSSDQ